MENNNKVNYITEGFVSLVTYFIENKKELGHANKTFDREFLGVDFKTLALDMLQDEYLVSNVLDLLNNSYTYNINKQYPRTGEEIWNANT